MTMTTEYSRFLSALAAMDSRCSPGRTGCHSLRSVAERTQSNKNKIAALLRGTADPDTEKFARDLLVAFHAEGDEIDEGLACLARDRAAGTSEFAAYLAVARRPSEVTVPYVPQSVVSWNDGNSAPRSTARPATDVFMSEPLVAVLGEPGGGKSELLRLHERDVAARWADGDRAEPLPVVIPATALSGTPEDVAGAAARALSYALELPSSFFRDPPAPGRRWLVLLDGLDEITNVQSRRRVLHAVVRWIAERPDTHRLVVATRHLSRDESQIFAGERAHFFELLRFETADVRRLAADWLGDDRADGLMTAVGDAGLGDLARIPLIGSILCRQYLDDPEAPPARTRGAIYDQFMIRLMATTPYTATSPRDHVGDRSETGQSPAWHGPEVEQRIQRLGTLGPVALRRLLQWVALRRRSDTDRREAGRVRSFLDVALEHDSVEPPAGVPVDWWRRAVVACLRRSGVLRVEAGTLEFAHPTYEEFLAACEICADPGRGLVELRRILGDHRLRHWPWRPVPGYARQFAWGRRMWTSMAPENTSYFGFLIDRLADAAGTDLTELTRGQGVDGCMYLATQKQLGTYLPAEVEQRAVAKLRQHIVVTPRDRSRSQIDFDAVNQIDPNSVPMAETIAALAIDDSRVGAAEALLAFTDTREEGLTALRELADAPRLTSIGGRTVAAVALVNAGDESGLTLLERMMRDCFRDDDRLNIAWRLAELDAERVIPHLQEWVGKRLRGNTWPPLWYQAGRMLIELDEVRGVAALAGIAGDEDAKIDDRLNAAGVLAARRHAVGAESLAMLARNPRAKARHRISAAESLVKCGQPETAATIFAGLAGDAALKSRFRRTASRRHRELSNAEPGVPTPR
ncbi:hypothetical protein QLQ12_40170 [Actinoplanes sp. NEAU-A12]|uniref:NACHT domain-containing protein n=1 Tax=Actinoplanes sandaracinus TaxID=3045177 RepID=A0ABT6WYK4_9ACTN|nr:hypothetical protein [Actinoplanes sandaracinus]MDI6104823.1 hypothetical protein [Actinoplanes sandaracinus]